MTSDYRDNFIAYISVLTKHISKLLTEIPNKFLQKTPFALESNHGELCGKILFERIHGLITFSPFLLHLTLL